MKRRKTGSKDGSLPLPMMGSCIYLVTGQSTLTDRPPWCCAVITEMPMSPEMTADIAMTELSHQPQAVVDVLTISDRAGYYVLVQMPNPQHRDVWVPTPLVLRQRGMHAMADELQHSFRHRYGKPMRKVPFYFREGVLPCPETPKKTRKLRDKPKTGTSTSHNHV